MRGNRHRFRLTSTFGHNAALETRVTLLQSRSCLHICLVACCAAMYAQAAEIRIQKLPANTAYLVSLSGSIDRADSERFIQQTSGINRAVVVLDSSGGSVLEGLAIGRNIRDRGFFTAVPNNTLCASSCALIWLAGMQRFAEESSFIGFHAAYILKDGKATETGAGNALIGSYLNQLGLSDHAILFITSAPPEGIERLDQRKAAAVGIIYKSVNYSALRGRENSGPSIPSDRKDAGLISAPYDPVLAVTRFYKALSQADGNAASALVVPEKRGIGPFNEKNISSFFGSMIEPLTVQSIERTSKDTVQIRYTYRVTKTQCVGIANVRTEYVLGNTLIQGIKANC